MSLVRYGGGITEINGQVGGDVFRRDRCGNHAQATPRHIDGPPSGPQVLQRKCFRRVLTFWQRNWTREFAAKWRQYAQLHPRTNKKGETIILTDGKAFMSINIPRCLNNLEFLKGPPD